MAEFYANPLEHRMLRVDGVGIACGIVVADQNGRLWGFLDVRADRLAANGVAVVRAVHRYLTELDKPVYVLSHVDVFPTADRLLTVLGFRPTEHTSDGKRIWLWQN